MPTGIEPAIFESIHPRFQPLKDAFQQTAKSNSYYNLLNDASKLLSQYNSNPKTYSILNASLDQIRLTHDYSKSENPIDEIIGTYF